MKATNEQQKVLWAGYILGLRAPLVCVQAPDFNLQKLKKRKERRRSKAKQNKAKRKDSMKMLVSEHIIMCITHLRGRNSSL